MSNDVANAPTDRLTFARALQCMGLFSSVFCGTAGSRFSLSAFVPDSFIRGFP